MKIATTRIAWVDALKGFAILMVVLGHILQRFYSDDTLAVRFIYSFHVPLFMFLSGYVSYKIFAWNSLEKRFWQLIVPFFSAIVLDYLIISYRSSCVQTKDFGSYGRCFLLIYCLSDAGKWQVPFLSMSGLSYWGLQES